MTRAAREFETAPETIGLWERARERAANRELTPYTAASILRNHYEPAIYGFTAEEVAAAAAEWEEAA